MAAFEADNAAYSNARRAASIVADYEAERVRLEAQEAADPTDHEQELADARADLKAGAVAFVRQIVADRPMPARLLNPALEPVLDENGDAPEWEASEAGGEEDEPDRYEHVPHPVTVFDVGAGVGKTRTIIESVADAIKTPNGILHSVVAGALNHKNQDDMARAFAKAIGPGAKVTIVRTRDKENCPRFAEIEKALKADPEMNVSQSFCRSKDGERCSFYRECGFQAARREIAMDPVRRVCVYTHAMLLGYPDSLPDNVQGTMIDEDPTSDATKEARKVLFGDLADACIAAQAKPRCADQRLSLIQFPQKLRAALESVTAETIIDAAWLDAAGLDPDMLAQVVMAFQVIAGVREPITPAMAQELREGALRVNAAVSLWERRANLVEALRKVANHLKAAQDMTITAVRDGADFALIVFVRKRLPEHLSRRPVAILDGTANLIRIEAAIGPVGEHIVAHPRSDPSYVTFEFLAGAPTKKKDLLTPGSTALEGHKREIVAFHQRVGGDVLVTGPDAVLKALCKLGLPSGVDTLNSARAVGTNDYEHVTGLYVLAQERPDHRVMENRALALSGKVERLPTDAAFWPSIETMRIARDGQSYLSECYTHPDPLALALFDRACVDAIEQGIARARPLNRPGEDKRLVVVLACATVPERIAIDKVRPWAQGEGGLAYTMAYRHGGVVIGSDVLVAKLLPDMFVGSDDAARVKAVNNYKAASGWPTLETEFKRGALPENIENTYTQVERPAYFLNFEGKTAVWVDRLNRTSGEVVALFAEQGVILTVSPYVVAKDRQTRAWEIAGFACLRPAASFHLGRPVNVWPSLDAAKLDSKTGKMADAASFVASTPGARSFSFMMKPEGSARGLKVEIAVDTAMHADPVAAIYAAFPIDGAITETTPQHAGQAPAQAPCVVLPFRCPAQLRVASAGAALAGLMMAGWYPVAANDLAWPAAG